MRAARRCLPPVILGLVLAAAAAGARAEPAQAEALSVELPEEVRVAQGQRAAFTVALHIRPAYHAMANPASQEFLVPTSLTSADPRFELEVSYPPGTKYRLPGLEPIAVYGGTVTLKATLVAPPKAAVGATRVALILRYQACNANTCLRPVTLPVALAVQVVAAEEAEKPPEAPPTVPAPAAGPDVGDAEEAARGDLEAAYARGLFWTSLIVFLAGLALNLTPCVFPLLPVTMGFFASQGEHRPSRTFPMALVYVLALAAVFTALGVTAAFLGKAVGAILQSLYGRVGISVLLALLAASLFGAFEIRLPSGFLARYQGTTGLLGAAIMGGAVGLVAAPCVSPFLSTLILFVADSGSVRLGALLFFILALGLGLPYLFLGIFTGLITRVPRAGGHLFWFKRVLAFPLLALIVYFLSASLPEWLVWTLYAAVALAAAVYLGALEGLSRRPWARGFVVARAVVALVAAGVAVGIFAQRVLPSLGVRADAGRAPLSWRPFEDGDLAAAGRAGTPAVVYFTARWCTYCRTMDRTVFRDGRVAAAAEGMRLLKVDLTDGDAAGEAADLQREHVHGGPPVLLFFDRSGRLMARRGQVETEEFLALLKELTLAGRPPPTGEGLPGP